jgi:hypothetical protein
MRAGAAADILDRVIDNGGAHAPLDDEGPLGRGRVPVQFTHGAGLEPHRNPRQPLGNRLLRNRRLPTSGTERPHAMQALLNSH